MIREFQPADAEAVAGAFRTAVPYVVTTGETVRWLVAQSPPRQRYRVYVAEQDGAVVGSARVGLAIDTGTPGQARMQLDVHPRARRRGAGSDLLRAAEAYLAGIGATRVHVGCTEDSLGFATARGYQAVRSSRFQRLDLARAALPELAVPAGVRVAAAAELGADPRPLYDAEADAARDVPGTVATDAMTYQDWLGLYWNRPEVSPELTSLVYADGLVVAYSLGTTDGHGRFWSAMTGCRRAYRGRGLAKLAKRDALSRAAAAGCVDAIVANDDRNAPMLAVNRWLGYQHRATAWSLVRDL